MVNAYIEDSYKLVFPILCNGYLRLDYDVSVSVGSDNSSTTAITRNRNIWAHDDSFTLEAIITPYDVNGAGSRASGRHGVLDSQKTPPYPTDDITDRAIYESVDYLGASNYLTQKMMIFYNQYVQLYLENTTSSSYNQPAEYKVVAKLTEDGGSTKTVQTDAIIKPVHKMFGYYDSSAYYDNITTEYQRVSASASVNGNDITVGSNEAVDIGAGSRIYDSSTTLIGTVASVSGDVITLSTSPATTVTSTIYTDQLKEALYIEDMFKISLVFLKPGSIELWVNDALQVKESHTLNSVTMHPSDCKIGRGSDDSSSGNNTQFFGELFEIALHKGKRPCSTTKTLTPGFSDILFFYTFGD